MDELTTILWLMRPGETEPQSWRDLFTRPAWMDDAACRDEPTALFFPKRGESTDRAKAICARCPVREECLDYSLETPTADGTSVVGIWGGLSDRQRRQVRSGRLPAAS